MHKYIMPVLFILLAIIIYMLLRYVFGKILYLVGMRYYRDYPGPKLLIKGAGIINSSIDWLFIHGACSDARIWSTVLDYDNMGLKLAAISLGGHENIPTHARPDLLSASDLTDFLKHEQIDKGIVGHSTASMWMASSYKQNPENWSSNIKILLIAPNFGNNVIGYNRKLLKIISYILPNPFVYIFPKKSCFGTKRIHCKRCKQLIKCGRKLLLCSVPYYQSILKYMDNKLHQAEMIQFLEKFAKQITIMIAKHDRVINNDITLKIAKEFNIRVIEIETSHNDIIHYVSDYLL